MTNKKLIQVSFFIGLVVMVSLGCIKSYQCKTCGNKSPIAEAGNDTTLRLPVNLILLDGSASYDPDGSVVSYRWSKRTGPPSFQLPQPNIVRTEATDLTEGEYLFQLEVIDNSGQLAKDIRVVQVLR